MSDTKITQLSKTADHEQQLAIIADACRRLRTLLMQRQRLRDDHGDDSLLRVELEAIDDEICAAMRALRDESS